VSEVPLPQEIADQLREAHETYRHLVEGIPAVLYVDANDDHSSNIYTSPQIEPLLGFTVEQWRDDPALWVDRMHEDDRERVLTFREFSPSFGGLLARHSQRNSARIFIAVFSYVRSLII